jgi:hypothetical protein
MPTFIKSSKSTFSARSTPVQRARIDSVTSAFGVHASTARFTLRLSLKSSFAISVANNPTLALGLDRLINTAP